MALGELLRPGRLVTVVGLGGAGKTRLAAELVRDEDCVWVDLSTATGPDEVASRVAEDLGIPAGGGADATVGVVNALRDQPSLLVLDNCEVQLAPCRVLVDALLVELDAFTILATSRMPLASVYEWLYPLPPLAEGNELFADRATRVGYAPLAVDAAAVSELCRRVGGSPLAIELLAAWAHVKSPVELLAGQSEELATRTLTVQPRHRDIAAVLDASMALLSPGQQRVLAALGVFAGGFTADAAESVAQTDLGTLAVLVERGLIFREPTAGGRFAVHELVRSHALARLRSDGQEREEAVRRRHFDYFVGLAEPWTDHAVFHLEPHRSDSLMAENANLDAARRWAVGRGDAGGALRLMQALLLFWPYSMPPQPRRLERLAAVLALPYDGDDQTVLLNRAWACHAAGELTSNEPTHALEWFQESLEHFRGLGHEGGEAAALRGLMVASLLAGELEAAEAYSDEARTVVQRTDDRPGEAWRLYQHAMLALARDQPDQAASCAREAQNVFGERGADYGIYSAYGIFSAVCLLGKALCAQGRYADAVAAFGAAVEIQERTGFVRDVEDLLEDLAILAATLGAYEQAAELFGAGVTWRAIDADPRASWRVADYRAATAASRRGLGPQRWQTAFDAGAKLTSRQAIGLAAAAVTGLAARASASALGLTTRERQVLSLVAAGTHDQEVAEQLQLSRRTVHAHLRSVYAKLDVTTRTAAARRAAELGLLGPTPD
jgi:predicted ATPase/DNA-binding CsgD family transcriptional regulator